MIRRAAAAPSSRKTPVRDCHAAWALQMYASTPVMLQHRELAQQQQQGGLRAVTATRLCRGRLRGRQASGLPAGAGTAPEQAHGTAFIVAALLPSHPPTRLAPNPTKQALGLGSAAAAS